jgi:CTP:molybdopterin cytidylyltransferase MocA
MPHDDLNTPPAAVILAAGASSRMGTPKALLHWQNSSFLEKIYRSCRTAGITDIVVVTGADSAAIYDTHHHLDTVWMENPCPEQGMLSSVRCGLKTVPDDVNIMLCLVDHPAVKIETYRKLISVAAADTIVIPVHTGRRGHPVIFGSDFILELLTGDCPNGARSVVRNHPEAVLEIDVVDPGILWDIDTPEEYSRYKP